ncbi:MAG: RDD family protein [Rhodothermales bacterium]
METVQIQTAQNVGIDVEVAGVGDRVVACIVDYLVVFSYFMVGSVVVAQTIDSIAAMVAVVLLPGWLYFLCCHVFFDGQTLGKYTMKIRVSRLDGRRPTLGNYVLRWLLRFIDIDLSTGMVGLVTILVNGQGQRLGDIAAGTTVVKVQRRLRLTDTLFMQVDDDYTVTFLAADQLSDDDILTTKEVLTALRDDGKTSVSYRLGEQLRATLARKMNTTTDLSTYDFLRTVIQDYNHLKGRL